MTVISGYLSGFPVGAVCVARMYKQGKIAKSEAEKLICYINNPSAPFVIGVVGKGLLNSTGSGILIYVILIAFSVIVGILLRSYSKTLPVLSNECADLSDNDFSFSQAVKDGALSMVSICGSVVTFSVISGYLSMLTMPLGESFNALLCGFLEISNGISFLALSVVPETGKFILAGVICAFSGLSVHVQISSALRGSGIDMKLYLTVRIISTVAVAVICALISFLGVSL